MSEQMEKYGTDLNDLPPTDSQIVEIEKLAAAKNFGGFAKPKSYQEAVEFINSLRK